MPEQSIPGVDLYDQFYKLAKRWGVFDLNSAGAPSFDELPIEDQIGIMEREYARQMQESQYDEDTEGSLFYSPEMQEDFQRTISALKEQIVEDPNQNPLEGDLPLTEEVEYPLLTDAQVQVLKDTVNEVWGRVDRGEYDWEDADAAIRGILDRVGIPYDPDSLDISPTSGGAGIRDNDGLISNRYIITENPEEAVAGGGGGDMSPEDVLAEVGAGGPTGGPSGGGGDDSQPGNEEQWVYIGDGVFRHESGQEVYNADAAQNDAYVPGETYSGPNPTEVPGTVNPSEYPNGGLWIGGIWYPRTDTYEGDFGGDGGGTVGDGSGTGYGGDFGGPSDDGPVVPGGTPGTGGPGTGGPGTGGPGTGGPGGGGETPGLLPQRPSVQQILYPDREWFTLDNIPDPGGLFGRRNRRRLR